MQITVKTDKNNTQNILDLIEKMGYSLPCNCHGAHACSGTSYSFNCSLIPKEDTTITLPDSACHTGTDSQKSSANICGISLETIPCTTGNVDTLLVDLGTTTVALVLMDSTNGTISQKNVFSNPQIKLGADVISRIHASRKGHKEELSLLIRQGLQKETERLCKKGNHSPASIKKCLIGGNTTMIHLLMDYDCTPLATAPFLPKKETPAPFFANNVNVRILPWISGFIGGDITAGMLGCHFEHNILFPSRDAILLIDLGTNGEIVLTYKGKTYATATAAGPALEGGCLSCGIAAIPGAISHATLSRKRVKISTIDNKLPLGICGSGALSLAADLIQKKYVSENGILSSNYPEEGLYLGTTSQGKKLYFTPADFRQIQLATAAIGAGIDTLCREADILPENLSAIYLAGGFGFFLRPEDAITLRMLPPIGVSSIIPVGNSCLQGLYRLALDSETDLQFLSRIKIINLAENPVFQNYFLHHMTYTEELISTTKS